MKLKWWLISIITTGFFAIGTWAVASIRDEQTWRASHQATSDILVEDISTKLDNIQSSVDKQLADIANLREAVARLEERSKAGK